MYTHSLHPIEYLTYNDLQEAKHRHVTERILDLIARI